MSKRIVVSLDFERLNALFAARLIMGRVSDKILKLRRYDNASLEGWDFIVRVLAYLDSEIESFDPE